MYKVLPARSFERDAKVLFKKYASLRNELAELGKQLALNPTQGTPIGHNCYKIRQAIKSKGKGKSGGARVISFIETEIIGYAEKVSTEEIIVNLLSIYDKSEVSNISDKELKDLIKNLK